MSNILVGMGVAQLERAIEIKRRIQELEEELVQLSQDSPGASTIGITPQIRSHRGMSAAGRARIAAAQKARWAKFRGNGTKPKVKTGSTARRKMSAAGRARIAAAAKARWAKAKAAGKNSL